MRARRRAKKEERIKPRHARLLVPADRYQERKADLAELDAIIANSGNLRFVESASAFRAAFEEGDEIAEFCTDKTSWRTGMGTAWLHFEEKRSGGRRAGNGNELKITTHDVFAGDRQIDDALKKRTMPHLHISW